MGRATRPLLKKQGRVLAGGHDGTRAGRSPRRSGGRAWCDNLAAYASLRQPS